METGVVTGMVAAFAFITWGAAKLIAALVIIKGQKREILFDRATAKLLK